MKYFMIVAFTLISFTSSPTWGETMNDLVTREGIYYKKFSEIPFTGKIVGEEDARSEGSIVGGLKEGQWVNYYENGQLLSKGLYKSGLQEGSWVEYYGSGQLYSQGDYKLGLKEGPWEYRWGNGQLDSTGDYKNGIKEGRWVYLQEDGNGVVTSHERGDKDIQWEGYNPDGNISDLMGQWKDGQKISMETTVNPIDSLDPATYDAAKVIGLINASTLDDATKTNFISAIVMAGTDPVKQSDVIAQIRKALQK